MKKILVVLGAIAVVVLGVAGIMGITERKEGCR